MKKRLIIILFLVGAPYMWSFRTLSDAQAYEKALQKGRQGSFDGQRFKSLLEDVIQSRENIGYTERFILKLTPYPLTTFIIWGPLKGAFGSLVRTLTYLQSLGILDNDLRLTNHATYLVFNGDVIGGTKASLETLSLVLSLMRANPKNVFYMKGQSEDALYWQNDGLKQALRAKLPSKEYATIPLGNKISQFFETLPLALYLTGLDPHEGSIRISYFSRGFAHIDEKSCGRILTSKAINEPQICYLSTPQTSAAQVKALIKSEQRLMSYQHHPGLMLVEPDKGLLAWSIFSGPDSTYQRDYQFFNDSFAIIKTGTTIAEAVITLHNTDIRTTEPIQLRVSYNLLTGMKAPVAPPAISEEPPLAQVQENLTTLYRKIDTLISQTISLTEQVHTLKKGVS